MWIIAASLLLLNTGAAHAGTTCLSVDAFNTWQETHAPVDTVTVTFDVTGVNPNDFFGIKGALVDVSDVSCTGGASNVLKVYGHDDPPNTAHPGGTLKQEYGNACCTTGDCGETWADPNASAVIFVDGSEVCDVTVWIDPDWFGYRLECAHGTFEGLGENTYDMPVNRISLFELTDGSTWQMPNARSTYDEVCFPTDEGGDTGQEPGGGTLEVVATQDVTVSSSFPDGVYPDVDDLSIEHADSEVYLQFDLSGVPGRITSATLELEASTGGSAEGSGADAWVVVDNAWNEASLTWNSRPARGGAALARVAPVSAGQTCTWDVSSALSLGGVYSFGLLPQSGDTNGVHLLSKEASTSAAPRLRLTWVDDGGTSGEDSGDPDGDDTATAGGDTATAGGDSDSGSTDTDKDNEGVTGAGACACGGGPVMSLWGLSCGLWVLGRRREPGASTRRG